MSKKKSSTYWKKRFSELENANNQYGLDVFHQIEPAFDKAQRQIQAEIEAWYMRYAKNNGITMAEARKQLSAAELKELQWDVQEYIKYGKENAMNQQWMKELENASARFHVSRLEALKLRTQNALEVAFGNELDGVDNMLKHLYQSDYYHTCFEVQKGFNLGWEIGQIDERKLQKVISKPWASDGKNFSERIWTSKTKMVNELHQQMTRTILQGKAPDQAIKHMINFVKDKTKNAKYSAGRLVMTEQAFISSSAQKDAFNDLDVEEFEVVATLDSHTSDICRDMDGQHFIMKDYEIGVTAPPFHVWCRSCTVPYFDDEWGRSGERAAKGEDGKTYYVPSDISYHEWEKAFVDGNIDDLTIVSYNDTITMGALSGALNPNSSQASKHAFQYYESVRKMKTDCAMIAKKTGYPLQFVEEVKKHLFMTKHDLGNNQLEYFFPDYEIAQSWQRLMDSKMEVQKHDLILLQHEHAEYLYMQEGLKQSEAHKKAEEQFNYAKALKERK